MLTLLIVVPKSKPPTFSNSPVTGLIVPGDSYIDEKSENIFGSVEVTASGVKGKFNACLSACSCILRCTASATNFLLSSSVKPATVSATALSAAPALIPDTTFAPGPIAAASTTGAPINPVVPTFETSGNVPLIGPYPPEGCGKKFGLSTKLKDVPGAVGNPLIGSTGNPVIGFIAPSIPAPAILSTPAPNASVL